MEKKRTAAAPPKKADDQAVVAAGAAAACGGCQGIPKDFENYAFVLYAKNDARFVQHQLPPAPGPHDVQIRAACTGICGSDLHYWKDMALGNIKVKKPMVLGHESSGTVVAVGSEVKSLKPGDKVCYEPSNVCLKCEFCQNRQYNICVESTTFDPPYNGSLTYYYNHPERFVFKLPDNCSYEEGALIEPISIAVWVAQRGRLTVGDKIFITGSGPIGLLMIMMGQVYGCTKIVITDIREDRLKVAKELGAETILIDKSWSEEEICEKIHKQFQGDLPNKTFECSGIEINFRIVLKCTRTNGLCVFVGMGPTDITLPVADFANREVDLRTIHRSQNTFPLSIELVARGKLPNLKKLITHRFDLKDSAKAFDLAKKGEGIKIMIKANQEK